MNSGNLLTRGSLAAAGGTYRADPHHEIIRPELLNPGVDFEEAADSATWVVEWAKRASVRKAPPPAPRWAAIPSGSMS